MTFIKLNLTSLPLTGMRHFLWVTEDLAEWYSEMCRDTEFMNTPYAQKLTWLKDDHEDIYDPDYGDVLRVAFMYKFHRGKMKDLVSLLGGRDFETRDYKVEIAEESFAKLREGVMDFMSNY